MAASDGFRVEFKAGRCERDGKKVKPIVEKGIVQISLLFEQNEILVMWRKREAAQAEEQHKRRYQIGKVDFRQIGNPASRVYTFEDKETNDRTIFWLQSPEKEKDQKLVAEVKRLITRSPPGLKLLPSSGGELSPRPDLPPPVTLNSPHLPENQPAASLQSILQNTLSQMGVADEGDKLELLTVLSHLEDIYPILSDPEVKELLVSHLPPTLQTQNELFETLSAPQFQETILSIENVIRSGQLQMILASSGISLEGVPPFGGTLAFLKAIQDDADKKKA